MVSSRSGRDNNHRVLFSVSWFHACDRPRHYIAAFSSRYDFRALSQATRGAWRWIYVIGAVTCCILNLFVAVCSPLKKFRRCTHWPDANRTPFKIYPTCCLVIFVLLGLLAVILFGRNRRSRHMRQLVKHWQWLLPRASIARFCNRPSSNGGETARHRSHCGAHIGSL